MHKLEKCGDIDENPTKMGVGGEMSLFGLVLQASLTLVASSSYSSIPPSHMLRVLALHNPPYTYSDGKSTGVDTLITLTIARKLNLTISFEITDTADHRTMENIKYVC